jgi:hypothetical protein
MAIEDETASADAGTEPNTVAATEPKKEKRAARFHYVVREPFGDYRKGHRLTDAEVIDAVHDAGHLPKLIRIPADTDFVEA